MRITAWSIDGFGIFRDAEVRPVAPGITVFHGPNEAGKSTLVAFLRGMLFGFDGRTRESLHPPLRGGRHAGRLDLDTGRGLCVIERQITPRRELRLRIPGGGEGSEADLAKLLGGVDARVYRSVFAFSLTELADFNTLTQDEVKDRIFSAGVGGAGRAASLAMSRLRATREELLNRKHERNQGRIQALLARLHELETEEKLARRDADEYPAAIAEEARLEEELARIQSSLRAVEGDRQHYETLVRLWPAWHEFDVARRELAADPAMDEAETAALELLAEEIPALRESAREVDTLRADLGHARETLGAAVRELGGDWNEARVAAFDASLPRREEVRTWEERLAGAARIAEDARRKLELAEGAVRTAQERAKKAVEERARFLDHGAAPPDPAALATAASTLRRLRARLNEYRALAAAHDGVLATSRERERSLRALESQHRWSPSSWTLGVPVVLAGILGASAGFEWSRHGVIGAPLLVESAGAAALLAAAAVLLRVRIVVARATRARGEDARGLRAEYEESVAQREANDVQLVTLRTRIAEDAASIGLGGMPSFHEVEECDQAIAQDRARSEALERSALDLAAAERDLARAEELRREAVTVVASAAREESKNRVEWEGWIRSAGAPVALAPRGVLDFFALIEKSRRLADEARRLDAACRAREEALSAWVRRARAVMADGRVGRGDLRAFDDLAGIVVARRDRARHRAALCVRAEAGESALAVALGEGETARALRAELATGELDRWRDEFQAREEAAGGLDERRHETTLRYAGARSRRQALENSSDLARLQLEREAVIAEMTTAVERWRELALAESLIEATRFRFSESRRPAVLADASRLFAAVTDGRYTRIEPGGDEDRVLVIDRAGEHRETHELSRGTAEQLYLCIRLGYAADFARRSVALPLIMDDVLVNFDPARARAMAGAIAAFAREHQVLFFTCHPQVRDAFAAADATVAIVELRAETRAPAA